MQTWFSSYQVLNSNAIVASINVYVGSRNHDAEEGKTLTELEAEFMHAEIGTPYLFVESHRRYHVVHGMIRQKRDPKYLSQFM